MHFPAKVEESQMLKTGENQGRSSWEGDLGAPALLCQCKDCGGNTCPVNDGWSRFPLLSVPLLLPVGFVCSLPSIPVSLSRASIGTHTHTRVPWLSPLPGVCPCVQTLRREGGDTGLIPSCHMQGIGLQPRAPITLILACTVLATS